MLNLEQITLGLARAYGASESEVAGVLPVAHRLLRLMQPFEVEGDGSVFSHASLVGEANIDAVTPDYTGIEITFRYLALRTSDQQLVGGCVKLPLANCSEVEIINSLSAEVVQAPDQSVFDFSRFRMSASLMRSLSPESDKSLREFRVTSASCFAYTIKQRKQWASAFHLWTDLFFPALKLVAFPSPVEVHHDAAIGRTTIIDNHSLDSASHEARSVWSLSADGPCIPLSDFPESCHQKLRGEMAARWAEVLLKMHPIPEQHPSGSSLLEVIEVKKMPENVYFPLSYNLSLSASGRTALSRLPDLVNASADSRVWRSTLQRFVRSLNAGASFGEAVGTAYAQCPVTTAKVIASLDDEGAPSIHEFLSVLPDGSLEQEYLPSSVKWGSDWQDLFVSCKKLEIDEASVCSQFMARNSHLWGQLDLSLDDDRICRLRSALLSADRILMNVALGEILATESDVRQAQIKRYLAHRNIVAPRLAYHRALSRVNLVTLFSAVRVGSLEALDRVEELILQTRSPFTAQSFFEAPLNVRDHDGKQAEVVDVCDISDLLAAMRAWEESAFHDTPLSTLIMDLARRGRVPMIIKVDGTLKALVTYPTTEPAKPLIAFDVLWVESNHEALREIGELARAREQSGWRSSLDVNSSDLLYWSLSDQIAEAVMKPSELMSLPHECRAILALANPSVPIACLPGHLGYHALIYSILKYHR